MQINISVVVPAYNRETVIERCVRSIMAQTVPPFEIIVVDDGSTDGTIQVLESIECEYLKVIKQNHKGAQAARNLGILNAEGEYIAFLDSDDEWLPQMLERNVSYLIKEKGTCVLYTDGYICNRNEKKMLWNLPGDTGSMYKYLLLMQAPTFAAMLAKKETFLKIGLLDEKVRGYQEWETAIRLAKAAKFIHIKEPLFIYHQHDGDRIAGDVIGYLMGYAYIIGKHEKEIIAHHGVKGLNRLYRNLIVGCCRCRSGKAIFFLFKMMCINILFFLKRLIGVCKKDAYYKKER